MADINVERKGPSIWPWIIGLLVLALLIWAIAEMVDTDEQEMAEVPTAEEPVAAVPAPAPVPAEAPAQPLSALAPLGPEDEGRTVTLSGEVVGQPTPQGVWVLTDQNDVVFVRTNRQYTAGQNVSLTGTLQRTTNDMAESWQSQAKLTPAAGWTVQREMHLTETTTGMQPEMQPGQQPGMQPAQPGQQPPKGQQQNY